MAQIALIATGRVRRHRRFGFFIAGWAALMVAVSPPVLVMAVRRPDSGLGGQELFGDLGQLLIFALLAARAVIVRRDASAHERLMRLETAVLMLPALARWPSLSLPAFLGLTCWSRRLLSAGIWQHCDGFTGPLASGSSASRC